MMLGKEFAKLVPDLSEHESKLLLYRVLDDGYGKYFNDVFDDEDRDDPFFTQAIGAPFPIIHSRAGETLARKFIQEKGLCCGSWRDNWKQVALSNYKDGELGDKFVRFSNYSGNPLVLKQVLLSQVGCTAPVFTKEEIRMPKWWTCMGLDERSLSAIEQSAREFLRNELGSESTGFVGVTFGWADHSLREWHVYGDLCTANVFRTKLADLPYLFGSACFEVPQDSLEKLYASTYLCVVTSTSQQNVDGSCMYECPLPNLLAVKWVGTLPHILGSWRTQASTILAAQKEVITGV